MEPENFNAWLKTTANQFNQHLDQMHQIKMLHGKKLVEAMRYSLLQPSKKIRPLLFLALVSTQKKDLTPFFDFACALEAIHSYSLIHDDLPAMDDDDYRRGELSNHKKFDEGTAILAGDALLTHAFYLASLKMPIEQATQLKMIGLLAKDLGVFGLVGGQQADLDAEKIWEKDTFEQQKKRLLWIHTHKTARFFQVCLKAGAMVIGENALFLQGCEDLGLHFGLSFQIQNDLKALEGSPKNENSSHSDQMKKKLTYLSLLGEQLAKQEMKDRQQKSLDLLKKIADPSTMFFAYVHSLLSTP